MYIMGREQCGEPGRLARLVMVYPQAIGESNDVELIAGPVIFSVHHNGSSVMSHKMATWQTTCTD